MGDKQKASMASVGLMACAVAFNAVAGIGTPASPSVLAQKLKEREGGYAEKVLDSPLYAVWLSKTELKDSSNHCITNHASFHVNLSQVRPGSIPPKNLDEAMGSAGQKGVLQYQKDQVRAAADTNPMVKGMLSGFSKKGSKEPSVAEWAMMFMMLESSFTPAQRIAYLRVQQEAELVDAEGVKNRQWVSLEGRIRKTPVEEEERSASHTLSPKDFEARRPEFARQKQAIDAWVEQEFKVVDANARRQGGHGHESSPYLDVNVLHKVAAFDVPALPMRNGKVDAAYAQQLMAIVRSVGQKCSEVKYIVLSHYFDNMMSWGRPIGQTMYVRHDGQWQQEFVANDHAGTMGELMPDRLTMRHWAANASTMWDRRAYHPWFSPYEVSLMDGDSEKIVVPAKVLAPTPDEIRLVIMRTHRKEGVAADPDAHTMTEGWFGSGSLIVELEKVAVKSCTPTAQGHRCTYQLDSRMSFSGGGMAAISAAMLQRDTGSAAPRRSEEFAYAFEMTDRGWASEDMVQHMLKKKEESKEDIKRGIARGAKIASCGVTLLGPRALVPMACR